MSYAASYRFSPRLAFAVWRREATLYRRLWPTTILSTLFDPIVYLLAMGFGLGAYITQQFDGVSYLQFIAPGLVASSVMMASAYETAWNAFSRIHLDRSYEAMMSTPATLTDVVAGELAWAATRASVYAVVMLAVLTAFGLVQSWWALLVPVVGVLGGFMFACLGLAYTAAVKHMDQLTFYFTLGITPMYLFSGVFFPLDRLPVIVQNVAWFMPLYHLVRVMRGLVLGNVDVTLLGDVAWMVTLTVVAFGVPAWRLRRKLLV